jgi:hypothetical protein
VFKNFSIFDLKHAKLKISITTKRPSLQFLTSILVSFLFLIFSQNTLAQDKVSTAYKIGDRVEAEYTTWYPGKIVEVLYNGDQYKVELYPPDGGKAFIYTFPKFRLRASKTTISTPSDSNTLKYGKYGCTATKYQNGSYEYLPRGSFAITKDGKYTYSGFKKPSTGTFVVDKKGNILFKGGYFDGGTAEKIDRPNKFFLVFPANPDNRWTCSLIN